MNIEVAAVHEAGHAVLQWLAGGQITYMCMRIEGSEAKEPETGCPDAEIGSMESRFRKRLVMLLAGGEATQDRWPGMLPQHERLDGYRTRVHKLPWRGYDVQLAAAGLQLNQAQQAIADDALMKAAESVAAPVLRKAIDTIAATFAGTPPDADGMVRLEGGSVTRMCEELIRGGVSNPKCVDGLAGRKIDSRRWRRSGSANIGASVGPWRGHNGWSRLDFRLVVCRGRGRADF